MEENVIVSERKRKDGKNIGIVIMIVKWHRGEIGQSGRVRNAMAN